MNTYDSSFNTEVFTNIKEFSSCLDVGCWTGNLGERLIKEKNCTIDGIDNNEQKLKKAKKRGYGRVYKIDLNCNVGEIGKLKDKYDYIIFADVLEHLVDPEPVIKLLANKLSQGGSIIISIPNIAFVLYRLKLLFGKWDYEDYGTMDKTHLRFFTLNSLKKFIVDSGFDLENIYGYSEVKNRFFFLRILAKMLPSIFAIQFLVVGSKK